MKPAYPVIVSLLLLSSIMIISGHTEADRPREPTFDVEMDSYSLTVDVQPGSESAGVVTFKGNISCRFPEIETNTTGYVLSLQPDCGDWPVSSPGSIEFFEGDNISSFQISVQVPIGTSSSEKRALDILGRWSAFNSTETGYIAPVQCIVNIASYEIVDLQGIWSKEGEEGEWLEYEVNLLNECNTDVNVTLTAAAESSHIEIEPARADIMVREGGDAKQIFRVRQKSGPDGGYMITIRAETDEGELLDTHVLYYRNSEDITTEIIVMLLISSMVILAIIAIVIVRRRRKKERIEE